MFPGSPARLRSATPLRSVLRLSRPGQALGVWLRGCTSPVALHCHCRTGPRQLLASDDLGYLLRRCARVAVRDGERVVPVPASMLLEWRVLEVVLAAPYLPGPDQLRELFPAARIRESGFALPLGLRSAEEALSVCAAERLPVAATRIEYRADKR
jgi:hypothetical protein